MSLKDFANHISEKLLEGTTPPPADAFNKEKLPFIVLAGSSKFGNTTCPTCGKPPTETGFGRLFLFRDPLSAKEHLISGMCQACQDGFFE